MDSNRQTGRTTRMLNEAVAYARPSGIPVLVVALDQQHIYYMKRIVGIADANLLTFVTHENYREHEREYLHTCLVYMDHAVTEQREGERIRAALEYTRKVLVPSLQIEDDYEDGDPGHTIEDGWALLNARKARLEGTK